MVVRGSDYEVRGESGYHMYSGKLKLFTYAYI